MNLVTPTILAVAIPLPVFQADVVPLGAPLNETVASDSGAVAFANVVSNLDSTGHSATRFGDFFGSAKAVIEGQLLGGATLALSGFNGDGVLTPTRMLIGAGILVASGAVAYAHRKNSGYALARKYYGKAFDEALQKLKTCEREYRGCAGDDVKLLVKAAHTIEHIINLPPAKRASAIDGLLEQWQYFAPMSCYAIFFDAGVPAKTLLALAERIPDAFTRKQYITMANVGAGGFTPSFGSYLQKAAGILKSKFGELVTREVVTEEQAHNSVIFQALLALEQTGGVDKGDLDAVVMGGAGLGATMTALVVRGRQITAELDNKSRTGLIRTGKARVKEFDDTRDSTGLDDAAEEQIFARQTAEMVTAVLKQAELSQDKGADAVRELVEELDKVYPGASNMMSVWLMTPMIRALQQLAREHQEYFHADVIAKIRDMVGVSDRSQHFPSELSRVLEPLTAVG